MKIYVASSWRNKWFPGVVRALRNAGHDVYDFRNPPDGGSGFRWSDVGADWMDWTPQEYRQRLFLRGGNIQQCGKVRIPVRNSIEQDQYCNDRL